MKLPLYRMSPPSIVHNTITPVVELWTVLEGVCPRKILQVFQIKGFDLFVQDAPLFHLLDLSACIFNLRGINGYQEIVLLSILANK